MTPERPRWLDRWLQTDEDELLYVDQTIVMQGGLTLEEQRRVVEEHARVAEAQRRLAEAQDAYREALAQEEEPWDES